MKTLAIILFLTLVGTIAQAELDETARRFINYHCLNTDDSEKCENALNADKKTENMNPFTLTIHICSKRNVKFGAKRSTCLVEAARDMEEPKFLKDVIECRHAKKFWGGYQNEDYEETANCQTETFANRAARTAPGATSGGRGNSDGSSGRSSDTRN